MNALTSALRRRFQLDVERPPGPPSWRFARNLLDFDHDPMGWAVGFAQRYGDFAYARIGPLPIYMVSHPALVEQLLIREHRRYIKDSFTRNLGRLVGDGLITSHGETWKRHRKISAPALSRRNIEVYAPIISRFSDALCERWSQSGPAHTFDLLQEMNRLTLQIVTRALFGLEPGARPGGHSFEEVSASLESALDFLQAEERGPLRLVPEWLPVPQRKAFDASRAVIDDVFFALISERRANPDPEATDLLSRLLAATDDDGNPMTDAQLRDEGITMMLAGHETTSLALTYTFHLLSQHPDVEARLHDEVDSVLSGSATLADLERLPYTEAVLKESMRLLPPVWMIGREPLEPLELDGYPLPLGSQILISPWVLQRDPRWYRGPLRFKPERWLDGSLEGLPRLAYMPFGGGARVCIGLHFAMMEATLALATLARRFNLRRVGDAALPLRHAVTLRPATTLMFRAQPRDATEASS